MSLRKLRFLVHGFEVSQAFRRSSWRFWDTRSACERVNCRKITPEASYLADSNINSREITLGNFGVVELPLLEVSAS